MPLEIEFERIHHLPLSLSDKLEEIIPNDRLKEKRVKNLRRATYILIAKKAHALAGVFFIRNIFFLPNATWIVEEKFRRQGIGSRLLRRAQKDKKFITAVCSNQISLRLAQKSDFTILPLGVAFWIKTR